MTEETKCLYRFGVGEDCGARACPIHGTRSGDPYGSRLADETTMDAGNEAYRECWSRLQARADAAGTGPIIGTPQDAAQDAAECDCDEEYGPCELHGVTVCQREGASLRTADDLVTLYLCDVADLIGLEAEGERNARERAAICETLERDRNPVSGLAWFSDDDARDEAWQVLWSRYEDLASDAGYQTWWDDGYRIVRVTGGPLA